MSLRGRHFIDRVKSRVGSWLKLPCPPYGNVRYWDGVYKSLGPQDTYEWGNTTLADNLLEYRYQLLLDTASNNKTTAVSKPKTSSTFAEAIGIEPNDDNDVDKPIILLGCGNSKLGEDMVEHGWRRGPLIQADVVSRVVDTMAQRCAPLVEQGFMDFVEDDATQLSAFDDSYANVIIDKGLVDALFCAEDFTQVERVVASVHRVLKPGGIFLLFSLSQPEYLMLQIIPVMEQESKWRDVQVRQLESILMYRLEKNDEGSRKRKEGPSRESLQRKQKSKRR